MPAEIAAAQAQCGGIPLWAMIETPRAVLNAAAIADSGVACLVLGANDLENAMQRATAPTAPTSPPPWR